MALAVKNPPANSGDIRDMGSIPGLGRYPGGRNVYPLQYSGLKNSMDRELDEPQSMRSQSLTQLSDFHIAWLQTSFYMDWYHAI